MWQRDGITERNAERQWIAAARLVLGFGDSRVADEPIGRSALNYATPRIAYTLAKIERRHHLEEVKRRRRVNC